MCGYEFERELLNKPYRYICGVDEVGRGALFGPVVAGAVILDPGKLNPDIRDSKKLSPQKRQRLSHDIYEHALAFSIGWCWNEEIDEINILEATRQAMKMAVRGLQVTPDYVLLDGLKPDFLGIEGRGIIRGDEQCLSIAAASIIAKVFRDQLIASFSRFFPQYRFESHKGYPTARHKEALSVNGLTAFHRRSFHWSRLSNGG